jgi:hypothetical protein
MGFVLQRLSATDFLFWAVTDLLLPVAHSTLSHTLSRHSPYPFPSPAVGRPCAERI